MVKKVSGPNPNKFAVFRELEPSDYDGLEVFSLLNMNRIEGKVQKTKYYTASYTE